MLSTYAGWELIEFNILLRLSSTYNSIKCLRIRRCRRTPISFAIYWTVPFQSYFSFLLCRLVVAETQVGSRVARDLSEGRRPETIRPSDRVINMFPRDLSSLQTSVNKCVNDCFRDKAFLGVRENQNLDGEPVPARCGIAYDAIFIS